MESKVSQERVEEFRQAVLTIGVALLEQWRPIITQLQEAQDIIVKHLATLIYIPTVPAPCKHNGRRRSRREMRDIQNR